MAELPSEIMYDIFSRLPVNCLARFRCVSKLWCNYINDPYLETMHAERASNDPILIMFHQLPYDPPNTSSSSSSSILSFLEHKDQEAGSYTLEVRKKPCSLMKLMRKHCYFGYLNDIVLGSCNGLVYSTSKGLRDGNSLVVINPLRKECYELPPINRGLARMQRSWWASCKAYELMVEETHGLGFDGSTNTFKMVSVVLREQVMWSLDFHRVYEGPYTMVHVLGTDSWRKIPQVPCYPIGGEGVFANGCLHWLSYNVGDDDDDHITYLATGVITFDATNEEFGLINLPQERPLESDLIHEQLVDLHGEMGYVYNIVDCRVRMWVLKGKEWVMHCKFELKPLIFGFMMKVLGFWNANGDVLLTHRIHNRLFVYKLKSDKLDEVNVIGWDEKATKRCTNVSK